MKYVKPQSSDNRQQSELDCDPREKENKVTLMTALAYWLEADSDQSTRQTNPNRAQWYDWYGRVEEIKMETRKTKEARIVWWSTRKQAASQRERCRNLSRAILSLWLSITLLTNCKICSKMEKKTWTWGGEKWTLHFKNTKKIEILEII